jgi:hypothetical protein
VVVVVVQVLVWWVAAGGAGVGGAGVGGFACCCWQGVTVSLVWPAHAGWRLEAVLALPAAACLLPRIGRPLLALLKLLLLLRQCCCCAHLLWLVRQRQC